MGPFGTAVILPMFPELREEFGVTNDAVGWGLTAYLLPMAAFLLVSGTVGERYGKTKVLRVAFLLFAVASLATAFAPDLSWFLVGRAVMGSANAFFTPLLLAGLADVVPASSLGRHVGVYSSFQTAGSAFSPLAGGAAAAVEWRSAFVAAAVISLILMLTIPKTRPARSTAESLPIRSLFTPRVLGIGLALLFGAAGPFGAAALLVGLTTRDLLDLSSSESGGVLFLGSVVGLIVAPFWGRLVDSLGVRKVAVLATVVSMATLAVLALPRSTVLVLAVWCLTSAAIVGMVVTLQSLATTAVPENRGGALSLAMSLRFLGHALAPVLWVPMFGASPRTAFVGAALLGLGTVAALRFVSVAPSTPAD